MPSLAKKTYTRTKHLVFGYIRLQIKTKLTVSKLIPTSIIELCQSYYPMYQYIDFSIYNPDYYERIEMEQESKIILKTKTLKHLTGFYSKIGFNQGIIKWKLRCIHDENSSEWGPWCPFGKSPAIISKLADTDKDAAKDEKRKNLSEIWFHEKRTTTTIDDAYYLFGGTMYQYKKGKLKKLKKSAYRSIWEVHDELIMTLDFENAIFQIVRIRENKDDITWWIEIDNSKTYYPAFGVHTDGKAVYELVLN